MNWIIRPRKSWRKKLVPEFVDDPVYGKTATGKYVWEQYLDEYTEYVCPVCHKGDNEPIYMNYCPNCGTKLDMPEEKK